MFITLRAISYLVWNIIEVFFVYVFVLHFSFPLITESRVCLLLFQNSNNGFTEQIVDLGHGFWVSYEMILQHTISTRSDEREHFITIGTFILSYGCC